jgi:hypothetical protein
MERVRLGGIVTAAAVALLALTAAQRPISLAKATGGQWQITGLPGTKAPALRCVSDALSLAQFEHLGKSCSQKVLKDDATSTVIEYSCGTADFGHSQIKAITPRNLKIETQGISDNMPFNYVLQARWVGECPGATTSSRH